MFTIEVKMKSTISQYIAICIDITANLKTTVGLLNDNYINHFNFIIIYIIIY